jgi:hypothetical protein
MEAMCSFPWEGIDLPGPSTDSAPILLDILVIKNKKIKRLILKIQ